MATCPIRDVYLALLRAPTDDAGETVVIRVVVQPLVMWLWIGGVVMAIGTALAAFPGRRRTRSTRCRPRCAGGDAEAAGPSRRRSMARDEPERVEVGT